MPGRIVVHPAIAALAACAVLGAAGCSSTHRPAPVSERVPNAVRPAAQPGAPVVGREADPRPESYVVKAGDTLFAIALDNGLDYREIAAWNNLANPNVIRVGQILRLRAPASAASPAPFAATPAVEGRPIAATVPPAAGRWLWRA